MQSRKYEDLVSIPCHCNVCGLDFHAIVRKDREWTDCPVCRVAIKLPTNVKEASENDRS